MSVLLREVRPEDFARAGAVLGQSADVLGLAVGSCRRASVVSWVGLPTMPYRQRLAALAGSLTSARVVFDEACDALLTYARVLAEVKDLAVRADLADAEACDLGHARALHGQLYPSPQELVVRERARLLRAEALQRDALAAGQLAQVLNELADRAPYDDRAGRWGRSASRFAAGAKEPIDGFVALGGSAVRSVPFVGSARSRAQARREMWEAAKAVGQPWLAVEDLLAGLRKGEYAHALGGAMSAVALRRLRVERRDADLFGEHHAMHVPVLRALTPHADDLDELGLWCAVRAQRQFNAELTRFSRLPAPSVDDLLRDGVNLVQHEALGGHAILKHVGRDAVFLRRRQYAERWNNGTLSEKSSFDTQTQAEAAINHALHDPANSGALAALRAGDPAVQFKSLVTPLGRVVDPEGRAFRGQRIVVEFRRLPDGRPFVLTAMVFAR